MENNIEIIINKIKNYTYLFQFNNIIKILNENFSENFLINNEHILFLIMKFILIDKIFLCKDKEDSRKFFNDFFNPMLKKIYKDNSKYEKKLCIFNHFLYDHEVEINYTNFEIKLQSYFEKFINLLEKKLREFNMNNLDITNDNNNNINFLFFENDNEDNLSDVENYLFNYKKEENNKKLLFKIEKYNSDNENIKNISNNNNNINLIDNKKNLFKIKKTIIKQKNNNNSLLESNNNNNIKKNSDLSKNKPRKVNICKKIIRKFKKYLKSRQNTLGCDFWIDFVKNNYLPPFKFDNQIEFKSFSQNYLKWLFNHPSSHELYNDFIIQKGDFELNLMFNNYHITDQRQKNLLEYFFKNFSKIFSNYQINELYQFDAAMKIEDVKEYQSDILFDNLTEEMGKIENNNYEIFNNREYNRDRENIDLNFFDKILRSDSSSENEENEDNNHNNSDYLFNEDD